MTDIDQDTRRPHPMLCAVYDLLRRELDRMDNVPPVIDEELDYMRALSSLHESLRNVDEPVVLMPIPGFVIRHEDGGHAVYGWYFVLLASREHKIRRHEYVSFHYYRWTARRAGKAWLKRAQLVSERIARELSSKIEAER